MDGIIAVTYRCNARCTMCDTWRHPSEKRLEISAKDLVSLPRMVRLNVTGGEPFLKDDLGEILDVVKKRAKRVVISSNGFLTSRTLEVMRWHRDVGVRVSLDGMEEVHDAIRGFQGAYRKASETVRALKELGIKDLGIAVTISDRNAKDLVPLFRFAEEQGVELATAVLHNAYYFHKEDNEIGNKGFVGEEIRKLMAAYLGSSHPKNWFRACFTQGLIDHVNGVPRAMKCTMATDSFFVDPFGDIRPCNVMNHSFGNIKEKSFREIWSGPAAEAARRRVADCTSNCWMIGSVGHLMRKSPWKPIGWIASNKLGNPG